MQGSIIIPACNEEQRIGRMLEAYLPWFAARYNDGIEFLVVINGTTDRTREVVENCAREYPQVRIIEEPRPVGKGGALLLGFREARGDWIGFVDADGSTPPQAFQELIDSRNAADCIIASRWRPDSRVHPRQPILRRITSRVFNRMTRLLFGLRLTDTQCGAKLMRREALLDVLPRLGITRWAFDVDLLFQLRRSGYRIEEISTEWHDKEGSKLAVTEASLEMLAALIRLRLIYSPFRFVVKLYDRFLLKPMNFLGRDRLFRHALLLSAAAVITNLCNILFQMIVGRALPAAEYALLAAFLAVFAMAHRPLETLRTAMAHYTSLLIREGRQGLIGRLLVKWCLLTSVPAVMGCVIFSLFSLRIAAFFHLERAEPVLVAAIALPALFIAPILRGVLQGTEFFAGFSVATTTGAISRVLLAALMVYLVYPATGWALVGHVGGLYVSSIMFAALLLPVIRSRGDRQKKLPSLRLYLFWCFIIQLSTAILMTGDVVLVKRYLPAETDFAYAATLSRMAMFLSLAVVSAMFPKVSTQGVFTREHRRIYLRALLYTSFFVALSLVLCLGFPSLLHRILFNIRNPSAYLLSLTRGMAIVMALATLLNINVQLLLAQRRFQSLFVVGVCAGLYLTGTYFRHSSPHAIMAWACAANLTAMVLTTFSIVRQTAKGPEQPTLRFTG